MKIKTTQQLKNLKGKTINVRTEDGKEEPLTLGAVLADIVLAPHKTKAGFRPLRAYELAKDFVNKEVVEISGSEFAQIKGLVENDEAHHTMLVAQALEMLNAASE